MKDRLRIVHYINQFFGQFGGEDTADMGIVVKDGPVGPGVAFRNLFKDEGDIVGTVICGDNHISENLECVTAEVLEAVKKFEPDLFIAGPGFNAGRYGMACGAVTAAVHKKLKIPAVTGLFEENPGTELYSGLCYIVPTDNNARQMGKAAKSIHDMAMKLVNEVRPGIPGVDFLGTGPIQKIRYDIPGAKRAVDMALDKFYGREIITEVPMPRVERLPASKLAKPLSQAKLALVTDGGLVPKGNPDRMVPANSVKFAHYSIAGMETLDPADYEVKHQGYNNAFVLQDPNRLVPVDALRDLEHKGVIGKLSDTFYTTAGVMTTLENGKKFGQGIAQMLKDEGVDAVLLTST
jgi:glycine reductase